MAPVGQYVFAEVRSNIGRFHCREPRMAPLQLDLGILIILK